MGDLYIDEHEPAEISRLLDMAYPVHVEGYNQQGWADYHYEGAPCFCHGSTQYNCERKTWSDLYSGIEEVELQLQHQLLIHPDAHHRLYLEGVVEPAPKGILIYTRMQGQNVMRANLKGERAQTYKMITAWLRQIRKYWEVVPTYSLASTAITIGADYSGDQIDEEEHQTLRRMFKRLDYRIDPQAQRILGASGDVPFGPTRAEAVSEHFKTAWRAFKAPLEEWVSIPGIGKETARNYLRGLGRGDV